MVGVVPIRKLRPSTPQPDHRGVHGLLSIFWVNAKPCDEGFVGY